MLEGSPWKVQTSNFDAPRIKNRIVSVSEKLFQLGEILRMTYREVKRDVEGFVIVTLMEEGDFVAQMTGKPGFRLFEVLGRHHWNITYCDEDGFLVPSDRPGFWVPNHPFGRLKERRRKSLRLNFSLQLRTSKGRKKLAKTQILAWQKTESKPHSNMEESVMMQCSST